MNGQQTGMMTLAILVVGIVIYRVLWFVAREKRRNSGVRSFKPEDSK